MLLKLIDRGQYSKNEHLSETVAAATSILSYVEPVLVLPFVASRFHMALETVSHYHVMYCGSFHKMSPLEFCLAIPCQILGEYVHSYKWNLFHRNNFFLPTFVSSQMTATHQLKIAVMSVAFVGRSLFLTSVSASAVKPVDLDGGDEFIDLLMVSLSNALLGMDANDPPKTLATMQLIGSIFSNVRTQSPHYKPFLCIYLCFTYHLKISQLALLNDNVDELPFMPMIRFSEWLDEFLCRLFSLLLHLEPSSVV